MRPLCALAALSCLLGSAPALAEDRLEVELFEEPADEDVEADAATDDAMEDEVSDAGAASTRRALEEDAPAGGDARPTPAGPSAPPARIASAVVSSTTGAFSVALVGAGVAFAHAGLWALAPADMGWLVGLGFALLPVAGAAGGAAFGAWPFVDEAGLAVTVGSAALGAGLGALTGFGVGAVLAGPQGGRKVPGENSWSAIALTATVLGAGAGAALGAGTAAPFFTTVE